MLRADAVVPRGDQSLLRVAREKKSHKRWEVVVTAWAKVVAVKEQELPRPIVISLGKVVVRAAERALQECLSAANLVSWVTIIDKG
ncbi:hypothetical protein [Blastopirellula marina]|uniref:Uncharacterized protein n=1 Tax=Blastopirellula marina TaxID=124 RepID=A0A2S8G261_9BACT|nr:hypothetical protein [Blastopirellula marina]PQO38528.1 hypothetical protein C5Y98_10790 [Blastopirellula marina]PTL45185.1 hypothetical protein C5Y97_10800 [Blastopirellula marina]